MHVRLYTREGCHLCDDALGVLQRHGLQPEIVDIDADAELCVLHDQWVPVVEIDGRIHFRGRVDAILLQRILAKRR